MAVLSAWILRPLRYEPCPQFINVSQKALHIYWQFSAMSIAIHKIVSKSRCQSYFISRRSPHHGISKDSDLCASAHRCLYYAYARLIARVTFNLLNQTLAHNLLLYLRISLRFQIIPKIGNPLIDILRDIFRRTHFFANSFDQIPLRRDDLRICCIKLRHIVI